MANTTVNAEAIEVVSQLIYLGALIKHDEIHEVKRRIAIAKNATVVLTNIWKDKILSLKTKLRIMRT